MARIIGIILKSLLFAYLVIFCVSNSENITFRLIPGMEALATLPLFLMIIICLFIGVIIGVFVIYFDPKHPRKRVKVLERALAEKNAEIENLKKIIATPTVEEEFVEEETSEATEEGEQKADKEGSVSEVIRK